MILDLKTPRWALPLLDAKYKYIGVKGGRSSGKSHQIAELLLFDKWLLEPEENIVCIREVQKSIKFSSKKLIEDKIAHYKVGHLFEILQTEIRMLSTGSVMIFQGLQDHTSDSIKSLEGFKYCWVEEAQSLSKKSIELLTPTIRKLGSQIFFTWNPDDKTDAVEQLFETKKKSLCIHVNYLDNPFLNPDIIEEAEEMMVHDYERYSHIWLGGFNEISEAKIFAGKYQILDFEIDASFGNSYNGLDFGFANDPTAATRSYIKDNCLYIRNEAGKIGLELDDTTEYLKDRIEGIEKHVIRADNARPESISYLKRKGLPRIKSCEKGKGSVLDGITFIKSFKMVYIHVSCIETAIEFNNYKYKVDKRSGDIQPIPVDTFNHYIDSLRYALEPVMKANNRIRFGSW